MSGHPLWTRLKDILDIGATFPLELISDENRAIDLAYHRDQGNHKSLSKFATFINPIISEDIEHGFALPLPIDLLDKLPNSSLAPLGCHKQTTINDLGEIVPKYRLTHDQSFPSPSGLSVNLQVKKELLPPSMYSFVMRQTDPLHYQHSSTLTGNENIPLQN